MNIIKLYEKYYLPEHLQMHMLRVAACANLIIDNWTGKEINKNSIIRVSLLHDMGNILKITEDRIDDPNLLELRKKYFEKYGEYAHMANLDICKKEGLNDYEIDILEGKRSSKNEETMKSDSFEIKICSYCDQRVAPDGVHGIRERLEDAKIRYKNQPLSVWSNEQKADELINYALEIEKQIMQFCKIQPEYINDEKIQSYIEKLKSFDI